MEANRGGASCEGNDMTGEANRKMRAARLAVGVCAVCGRRQLFTRIECLRCCKKRRAYQRKRAGHKRWRRGGKGRPPTESIKP